MCISYNSRNVFCLKIWNVCFVFVNFARCMNFIMIGHVHLFTCVTVFITCCYFLDVRFRSILIITVLHSNFLLRQMLWPECQQRSKIYFNGWHHWLSTETSIISSNIYVCVDTVFCDNICNAILMQISFIRAVNFNCKYIHSTKILFLLRHCFSVRQAHDTIFWQVHLMTH